MLIIAERINASRKSISQAISDGDREFIQNEVKNQDQAGGDYIDVNAGTFVGEEADKLTWVIEAVQEAKVLGFELGGDPQGMTDFGPELLVLLDQQIEDEQMKAEEQQNDREERRVQSFAGPDPHRT